MSAITSVIGVYNSATDQFKEYCPMVYRNGQWTKALSFAYINGTWQPVGQAGTLMIPFILSDGSELHTSDGKLFQVRNHE